MWCLAELSSHWTYALRCMQTDMLGACCELVFLGHCIWSSQPDVVLSSPLLPLPLRTFVFSLVTQWLQLQVHLDWELACLWTWARQ